ncbi:MAG: ABC transporter ATP-binding protein [Acidobacteria bacterium]|nr:ABC transporter ATP-binding protein [Acidobacteriota bacterium]
MTPVGPGWDADRQQRTTVIAHSPEVVVFRSVSKIFRHHPALFNWFGRERAGEARALDSVSFQARAGEVLVLLGPNGSGKTTVLKLISTVLLPDEGQVLVNGSDTMSRGADVRGRIGFAVASERSFYPRLTARENLDLFAALDDVPRSERPQRVEWTLEATGLAATGDTLAMKFSSGMFQRLGIARALLKKPSVLLLDEPTRSLDAGAALHLWQTVRDATAGGAAVLLATHNFEEAVGVGTSVAVLSQGRVAAFRKLDDGTSVSELRRLYFQQVQPENDLPGLSPRGAS